jgi:hypothetical protein
MPGLAMLAHARHQRPDAVDDTVNVNAEDPFPLRRCHLPQRHRAERHAGVVEKEMDVAEFGLRLVGGAFEHGGVGNIDHDGAGSYVVGGEFVARDIELRLLDVGEHDVDAVARQRPADAKADTIGGTGHESRLAGEIHH